MTFSKLPVTTDCSAYDLMLSTSEDIGDEPRNWHTLSEKAWDYFRANPLSVPI